MVKVRKAVGGLFNLFKPEPLKPTLLNTAHLATPATEEAAALAQAQAHQVAPEILIPTTEAALEAFTMLDALKGAEFTSAARIKAVEEEEAKRAAEEEARLKAEAEAKVVPLFPALQPTADAFSAENVSAQLAAAEATQAALQQLEKLSQLADAPHAADAAQAVLKDQPTPADDFAEESFENVTQEFDVLAVAPQPRDEVEDAVIVEETPQEPVALGPVNPLDMPALVREKYIAHQLWLETEGREGKRFRYVPEDMQTQRFSGLNLAQAQFRGEDLYGMQLDGAILTGADFSDCNLQRANFSNAQMTGINFSRANLSFANLNFVQAAQGNFSGANMEGTMLREADVREGNLRDAHLQGTVAINTNFSQAQMRNATLFEPILEQADFTDADLRGAQLTRGVLTNAKFENTSFKGAVLDSIDFSAADFTVANDVSEDYQKVALTVARSKLQEARGKLDEIQDTLKRREYRIHETGRELSNKLQQLRQMEGQENKLLETIRRQGRWMRNSSFWWGGVVAVISTFSWFALTDMTGRDLNLGAVMLLTGFNAVVIALSVLSFYRAAVICRSVQNMLAARNAFSEQLVGLHEKHEAEEVTETEEAKLAADAPPAAIAAPNETPLSHDMMDFSHVMPAETVAVSTEGSDASAPQSHVA